MYFKKYKRMFIGLFLLNGLVSILQLGFAYGHYTKHEWATMCLSIFFFLFNGYFSIAQIKRYKEVVRDEKQFVWRSLGGKVNV